MCGITGILKQARKEIVAATEAIAHRGPDSAGYLFRDWLSVGHTRLSIVGTHEGIQPIFSEDGSIMVVVNGEVWNHEKLRETYEAPSQSDCAVLVGLARKFFDTHDKMLFNQLDGMFAVFAVNLDTHQWVMARDPFGIIPLYWSNDPVAAFSSELKGLIKLAASPMVFPPGTIAYGDSSSHTVVKYYDPIWGMPRYGSSPMKGLEPADSWLSFLRTHLEDTIQTHLMRDPSVGLCALLSGGLDSSLVAAIAAKLSIDPIHTYAIGLEGSADLVAAKEVASHIGSIHHEVIFDLKEGLKEIDNIIYVLETFYQTTPRASIPMKLLAKRIAQDGFRVALSGEGADETFGGYRSYYYAPSPEEFHNELVRQLGELHQKDCLRANKVMASESIECRVPYLDTKWVNIVMGIDPRYKICCNQDGTPRIEKYLLRKVAEPYLPPSIVWRVKEQFSDIDDGKVTWIDTLKQELSLRMRPFQVPKPSTISDWPNSSFTFEYQTATPPMSSYDKETSYYLNKFRELFPGCERVSLSYPAVACCSQAAKKNWPLLQASADDCSGHALKLPVFTTPVMKISVEQMVYSVPVVSTPPDDHASTPPDDHASTTPDETPADSRTSQSCDQEAGVAKSEQSPALEPQPEPRRHQVHVEPSQACPEMFRA